MSSAVLSLFSKVGPWLAARLQERSTYAGLAVVLGVIGHSMPDETVSAIGDAGVALGAALAVIMRERGITAAAIAVLLVTGGLGLSACSGVPGVPSLAELPAPKTAKQTLYLADATLIGVLTAADLVPLDAISADQANGADMALTAVEDALDAYRAAMIQAGPDAALEVRLAAALTSALGNASTQLAGAGFSVPKVPSGTGTSPVMTATQYATALLAVVGQDAALYRQAQTVLTQGDPTDAQLDAIEAALDTLSARVHAKLRTI